MKRAHISVGFRDLAACLWVQKKTMYHIINHCTETPTAKWILQLHGWISYTVLQLQDILQYGSYNYKISYTVQICLFSNTILTARLALLTVGGIFWKNTEKTNAIKSKEGIRWLDEQTISWLTIQNDKSI